LIRAANIKKEQILKEGTSNVCSLGQNFIDLKTQKI